MRPATTSAHATRYSRAAEEVGRALAALGRHDEALARLREVLDARRRLLGEDHEDTRRVLGTVEELRER